MLDLRKELHAIDRFYIWDDENGWHTGVWYWKVTDRRGYYEDLASKVSGTKGDLIAMLPATADFRVDPHDEGLLHVTTFGGSVWREPPTPRGPWVDHPG